MQLVAINNLLGLKMLDDGTADVINFKADRVEKLDDGYVITLKNSQGAEASLIIPDDETVPLITKITGARTRR